MTYNKTVPGIGMYTAPYPEPPYGGLGLEYDIDNFTGQAIKSNQTFTSGCVVASIDFNAYTSSQYQAAACWPGLEIFPANLSWDMVNSSNDPTYFCVPYNGRIKSEISTGFSTYTIVWSAGADTCTTYYINRDELNGVWETELCGNANYSGSWFIGLASPSYPSLCCEFGTYTIADTDPPEDVFPGSIQSLIINQIQVYD